MSAGTGVLLKKAAGALRLCRSSSHYITSRITNMIVRSTSAPKPCGCGRRRIRRTPVPELFAQGHALKSFRELAAGPARQLAGAVCLSRKSHRAEDRGRFHGADDGDQSVRFLCRALCRQFSVRLYRRSQDRTRALSRNHRARDRYWPPTSPAFRARRRARSIFWSTSTRSFRRRSATSSAWSRASRRRRRRCASGVGILPRLGVAADPNPAASRARGAFRLGLSHSAAPRHRSGRRAARGRERFHRFARLGRGLSAGRGLDRVRRHLGHADRRGAHSRRRHAALPLGGADQRARPDLPMSNSASR